jgi:hypothetical protein
LFRTFDSSEDATWVGGPDKGSWIGVGFGDEAIDGGLEIVDGSEDAALEAPARKLGEEALDGIEPGCGSRREAEGPARMPGQPTAHLGMFAGGVVVDDGVDGFSFRHLRLDGVEEADELLMAMALHAVFDNGAVEDIQRGEQRRGAVAFVVVRHGASAARLYWQPWLGAVECLDLALFIDREDDRMGGWVDIEADDILEFFGELRIVRRWSGCRFLDRPTQQQGQKAQPLRILVLGEFCCIEPSISI